MKILVLGANGMIGHVIFKRLHAESNLQVYGGIRNLDTKYFFSSSCRLNLVDSGDLTNAVSILSVLELIKPDTVINCAGHTKHKMVLNDPSMIMSINANMPHQLASACNDMGIRFIHISTDCVFSGKKGNYSEDDIPDASDLYGKSKAFGEVIEGSAITIRTSSIGHEINSKYGLLEWFLNQKKECQGFSNAIFSGLPSIVFAEIIKDFVLPNPELKGLYHVSADPINKYELLKLISKIYEKKILINQNFEFIIDRSLNYEKFKAATGYIPAPWPNLIETMYKNQRADIHNV